MEIVPVIYCRGENKDYTIPTPILGIYLAGFKFCLKCINTRIAAENREEYGCNVYK